MIWFIVLVLLYEYNGEGFDEYNEFPTAHGES